MKIHLVGVRLLHADGQTDMTKLIVAFCNFMNLPNSIEVLKKKISVTSFHMDASHFILGNKRIKHGRVCLWGEGRKLRTSALQYLIA